jgi:hypothetical protein
MSHKAAATGRRTARLKKIRQNRRHQTPVRRNRQRAVLAPRPQQGAADRGEHRQAAGSCSKALAGRYR